MADEIAAGRDPRTWSTGGPAGSGDLAGGTALDAGEADSIQPGTSKAAQPGDGATSHESRTCPWCSIELGRTNPDRCPGCGAALVEDPEISVPGVTAVDPEAVRRAATWERTRKGSSLRELLDSDRAEDHDSGVRPSSPAALEPPSGELRAAMVRLRAELQAAAEAEERELEAQKAEDARAESSPAAQPLGEESAEANQESR